MTLINIGTVNKIQIGKYIKPKEGYKAFSLLDFPPRNGFHISPKLHKKHEEAIRLIGKLDGVTRLLPDKDFFLLMFIKKDATYSSQIEGTKATLQDAVAAPVTEKNFALIQTLTMLYIISKLLIIVLKELTPCLYHCV